MAKRKSVLKNTPCIEETKSRKQDSDSFSIEGIASELNTLVATAGIGISVINSDYTIEWYNDVYTKWFGALEKKKSRKCYEVIKGRDSICPECPVKIAFKTGKVTETIRSIMHISDGSDRIVQLTTSPIFGTDGNIIHAAEIVKDITEQRRAEDEIKESEEQFRAIFEQAAIGVALLNTKTGQFININQKYCDLVGYTMQEMSEKTLSDITYSEDLQTNIDKNQQLIEGKIKEFSYEKRYVRKDGKIVWGRLTISPLWKTGEKPQTYLHIAIVEDIDNRKAAEESLKKSEASLKQAQEIAKMGNWEMDLIAQKLKWSENIFAIYGLKPFEVEPSFDYFKSRLHPDDISLVEESFEYIIKNKVSINYEFRVLFPDGTYKWLQNNMVPVFQDDKLTAIKGINIDITERKHSEEDTIIQNQRLQKINSEKDKLFSIIAHDLRSPFTGFLGFTEILKTGISDMSIKELKVIANSMNNSANNLFSLLTNLLEWSMMQRGLIRFNPEKLSVRKTIENVASTLQDMAKKKTIDVELKMVEDVYVAADKSMFETVLRNIISNAIKFTKKGGRVTISAKESDGKTIVTVKDTGIGMSNELLNDLFKIDINTSRKGTDNENSTGLGLLLCKEFVEKHNGKITVESEEGVGSEFVVTLGILGNRLLGNRQ